MSSGRAHLSVISLAALLLGALAAWGFFNYARAPKLTPELLGYQRNGREKAQELLSRQLPSHSDVAPRPPLRMPAFRGVITDAQLEDLVSYYKVIADFDPMPDGARAGYHAARDLGCFGCHGP